MNQSQLTTSLEKIFTEDKERIVFWNDPKAEFSEVMNDLEIADVSVINLDKTGGFEIKIRIECDEPETQFLLYSASEEPEFSDDLLLDMRLYSRSFRADRSSILQSELGLTQASVREHLASRGKFFDSKARVEKLKPLLHPDDNERSLDLKMLAVVCKSEVAETASIVRALFHMQAQQEALDLETPPPIWGEVEKFDLQESFWQVCHETFGYDDADPALYKLLLRMMLSDLSQQLGDSAPIAFQNQQLSRKGTHNTIACLSHWRDSGKLASSYNILASAIAEKARVANELRSLHLEALTTSNTFELVEGLIYQALVQRLQDEADHIDATTISELASKRRQSHWVASLSVPEDKREARAAAYDAIAAGAQFLALKNDWAAGFVADSAVELYQRYTAELYRFDRLYRQVCFHTDQAGFDDMKTLRDQIDAAYNHWFIPELSRAWGRFIDGGLLDNWQLPGISNQYRFFHRHITPHVRGNRPKRVFVVISDAFRYEAATELVEQLNGQYRFSATLDSQLGVVPSCTRLGMASLLPQKKLSVNTDGIVEADGHSTAGLENRNKILQKFQGIALSAEEFIQLKKDEARVQIKDARIVYLYHDVIDARSDGGGAEGDTFKATADAIEELGRIVKHIVNSANGSHVLVTADHGFLFSLKHPEEIDRSAVPKRHTKALIENKRYVIDPELPDFDDVWLGHTRNTAACDDDMQFWIPKGTNRFHFMGSSRFIHGGAMPQEVVVPVITIKEANSEKMLSKTQTKSVDVAILGSRHRITTASAYFKLVQMAPVSERVKAVTFKVAIYDGETVVSSIETLRFDSTSTSQDERTVSVKLTLGDHEFDKLTAYQVKLIDESTDMTVETEDVTIDRAISDDFF